ncbi:uncharacterized protein [Aquarana catesbeiana]|uniref:uncharacterized protein n=1 Tax=Aquarana catesbeiana TaxID=8400 RepID=UPI003CC9E0FD
MNSTIPYLKAKIGGLRSTYLRERKKVQDSQRSGAAADEVYVPRLWYYDRLRFLSDQTEVRESLSTLPSTLSSTPAEAYDVQPGTSSQEEVEEPSWSQEDLSQDEALECGSQEEAGVSGSQEKAGPSRSLTESQVPPLRLPTKRPRKGSNVQDSALHNSTTRATAWKEDQRVMALGSVWSDKRCRLLYDHSLGTYMSSAAVQDLLDFWTRLHSLRYGLLRPPIFQ